MSLRGTHALDAKRAEVDPREVTFPRSKGETWFGASSPWGTLDREHWDPQREIDECLDIVKQARQRCDDAFRASQQPMLGPLRRAALAPFSQRAVPWLARHACAK